MDTVLNQVMILMFCIFKSLIDIDMIYIILALMCRSEFNLSTCPTLSGLKDMLILCENCALTHSSQDAPYVARQV